MEKTAQETLSDIKNYFSLSIEKLEREVRSLKQDPEGAKNRTKHFASNSLMFLIELY